MLLREKIYLVVGIGTDIGKTFFVEKICQDLCKNNMAVNAIKPIASGFRDGDENSDSARILRALNQKVSQKNIEAITPWRFLEAISPHFAAEKMGEEIDFIEVKSFCQKEISAAKAQNKFLFIEAAGGVMTPINYQKTFLDLAQELQIPLLLLTANYLGAISHTLCAMEVLKNKKILVEKIIINKNSPRPELSSLVEDVAFKKTIEGFGFESCLMEDLFLEPVFKFI